MLLRTVVAAGPPAVTTGSGIVIAVAGKKPAIVCRPYHRFSSFSEETTKYRVIEEITVDVVDVYNVGIDSPDLRDQFLGGAAGDQPVGVEEPCRKPMEGQIQLVSHGKQIRAMGGHTVAGAAIGYPTLPSCTYCQFAEGTHDLAGGSARPDDRVDLQEFLHGLFSSDQDTGNAR